MMSNHVIARRATAAGVVMLAAALASQVAAAEGPRFAGPLLSPAPPLPVGMLNIEPYLINSQLRGLYDENGDRRDASGPDGWYLAVPIQYGLHERVTIAASLNASYNRDDGNRRAFDIGDTTLSALFGLYKGEGVHRPTLTLAVRQSIATGHHDRLEERPISVASGTGVGATSLGLHGQAYFLDGHLRMRASTLWRTPGANAGVRGQSAFGTPVGFDGRVRLGAAVTSLLAAEYSLSPTWVLAGELLHEREGAGSVHGRVVTATGSQDMYRRDPASWRFSIVPAIQYHWNDHVALVAGAQVSLAGRNSSAVFVPQVAVNMGW
ncbi:hypothetical protein ABB28_07480 [Stenotrophomonas chelatiphaga]|jgi:hypothetical protein|uniref:Transporter n=2 Tax=Stenotrophomonas chelatiphaga TaxID=517011 RepID=A0A0R0CXA9_9GAMM|nr:hypothetical protein [Stenotrophomonas chelatiphaga]KRG74393.1 hypothetical protein ABB28_07480 [Stenotrophomonas chelatiphaga]MCS4229976.1 hypothetical protein [Stenotrophomonas chelatiphaga]ROQ45801.1 hypothetical protein EDF77_0689 [Stenotrophomonas maltophilia]